jgi:hypothetical protein
MARRHYYLTDKCRSVEIRVKVCALMMIETETKLALQLRYLAKGSRALNGALRTRVTSERAAQPEKEREKSIRKRFPASSTAQCFSHAYYATHNFFSLINILINVRVTN